MIQSKFKTGDVVRLKSGGPKMTVDASEYGQELLGGGTITSLICSWFDSRDNHQLAHFSQDELELITN